MKLSVLVCWLSMQVFYLYDNDLIFTQNYFMRAKYVIIVVLYDLSPL